MAKLNFFESLSKPTLKGLAIAASTVAVVELLIQNYSVGISAYILVITCDCFKKNIQIIRLLTIPLFDSWSKINGD